MGRNKASIFAPHTSRTGDIVGVYETADYTKAKGWKLLWAQFDGIYPYFVLYNPHKALMRVFSYTDKELFETLLITLSYHDTNNNPGLLTFGNDYQIATDKYLSNSVMSNDMISVVIPSVGAQNWYSADFPIFFDNNIKNYKYTSKKWVLKLYGCADYKIFLKGQSQSGQVASTTQHSIIGKTSDVGIQRFSASHAKLHKQIETTSNALQKIQASVKDINEQSPKFLQKYKQSVNSFKPVNDMFSSLSSVSSLAGAILGFFKLIAGTFDENNSTPPVATMTQFFDLEGSMKIKYVLGGNTLKIPGASGNTFPPVVWEPFDCVMGLVNLEKTPKIRKTTAYEKYDFGTDKGAMEIDPQTGKVLRLRNLAHYPTLIASGEHPPVSGYLGKFVRYKFEGDNIIGINNVPGLILTDIRFALVFKLTGKDDEFFDIEQKHIKCMFWDLNSIRHDIPIVNPIYKALDEGLLKVYKYEKTSGDIIVGTPELSVNKLKDIVVEIPERSEISLRVIAIFKSDIYSAPIIFQGDFLMDIQEEVANRPRLFLLMEQTNFHWDSYYTGTSKISLNNTNSSVHKAGFIELGQNFKGTNGFVAKAIDIYPTRGNTIINNYEFPCNNIPNRILNTEVILENKAAVLNTQNCTIAPNPTTGSFTVSTNDMTTIKEIKIYDLLGNIVHAESVMSYYKNITLYGIADGMYIVKAVMNNNTTYSNTIVVKRL